ncbi:MAG TPA: hypothetical protein VM938_10620 [Acidimicrobiales bacterium]|nr:hypothetical protein [Acidimicrobiales bacterium]
MPEPEVDDSKTAQQQPTEDSKDFAKLRNKSEAQAAEITALRSTNAKLLAAAAGFDTSTKLASIALDQFAAERKVDEFTPEAFKAFAEEIGLPATVAPAGTEGDGTQAPAGTDAATALGAVQAQADAIKAGTGQAAPAALPEQIAAAEQAGDYRKSMELKDTLTQQQMAPRAPA